MCKVNINEELLDNKKEKEYVNIQTGEVLDLEKVVTLPNNSILIVKPELWCIWNFEKNNELGLDIWKMTKGSDRKVWWLCGMCNESKPQVIHTKIKGTGCPVCTGKVASKNNNLAIKSPELAEQWHPTLNGELTPNNVTPVSGNKVWWLCKNNHHYIAAISDRVNGRCCPYCSNKKVWVNFNNLSHTHPHLAKFLLNKEDGEKYTFGTQTKVDFICDCGNILNKPINEVTSRGLSCPKCKDGISFGEKVMYHLLTDNNIKFKYDSTTHYSGLKRYDFILTEHSGIIEIQGEHHSKEKTGYFAGNGTLDDEIENDKFKKEIALVNGIKNYFMIDVFDRDIELMSKNIINSGLLDLLNINSVNWKELSLKSQKSLILQVCEFYENNQHSTGVVASTFKLSHHTIINYLKIGNELNICTYTPHDSKSKALGIKNVSKKVVQYDKSGNFMKIHNSTRDAGRELGITGTGAISGCCKGIHKSVKGFIFRYYSDVDGIEKITPYRRNDNKSVVQLTLDNKVIKVHETITDAIKETGAGNISRVCNGDYSQCNGFKWLYLSQYEEMIKNKNTIVNLCES